MFSRMYIYPAIVSLSLAGGAAAIASPASSGLHRRAVENVGDSLAFVDLSATEVVEDDGANATSNLSNVSTPCKTLDDIVKALGPPATFTTTLPPHVDLPKILRLINASGTPCHPVFDCTFKDGSDGSNGTQDWSGEKIQWCCEHEQKGCFFNVQLAQNRAKEAWEAIIKLKNLGQEETTLNEQLSNAGLAACELESQRVKLTKTLAKLEQSLEERERLHGEASNATKEMARDYQKTRVNSEGPSQQEGTSPSQQKGTSPSQQESNSPSQQESTKVSLSSIATDENKVSDEMRSIERQEETLRKRKAEVDKNYTATQTEMHEVEEKQKSMSLSRVDLAVKKASLEAHIDSEKDKAHDELDEIKVEEGNVQDAEAAVKLRDDQYQKMIKDLKMRKVSLSAKADKLDKMTSAFSSSEESSSKAEPTATALKAKMNSHVQDLETISKDLMNADTELSSLTMKQVLLEKKMKKSNESQPKFEAFLRYEIRNGSTLVTLEKTPIWASPHGFETSGFSERGAMVVASGTPVIVPNSHLHVAVPIQPKGYIRAHSLLLKSLLLDAKGETNALGKIRHERGIGKGAPIVNVVAAPIYESAGSAAVIGHKDAMATSTASGEIVTSTSGDTNSYMVPIEPKGFLELDHVVLDYSKLAVMKAKYDSNDYKSPEKL